MIERYEHPIIQEIWSDKSKFTFWKRVELAACEVFYKRGEITEEEIKVIREAKAPTPERVRELEKTTDHDVAAFVQALAENVGEAGRHIHRGLTSSDVCDTAQALMIKASIDVVLNKLNNFAVQLYELALKYKFTPCIGRTHGVHAEITSFGMRFAGWYSEIERNIVRLKRVKENWCAKMSGAVGTYSQTDPEFEQEALDNLFLSVEPVSTQIVPRDRHAELLSVLSLIGGALERIALEIRSLQRTEIREVEEGFKVGQKGSSAMPHKHNPISSEKVCGLSRVLRGYMIVAHENIALWHDRDISHSSTERIILPDAFNIITHMIQVLNDKVFPNLQVFPENMMANIMKTGGAVFSQNVLGWLLSLGYSREKAYKLVQESAQMVLDGKVERMVDALVFLGNFDAFQIVELNKCFDVNIYLKHINKIFNRVFGE